MYVHEHEHKMNSEQGTNWGIRWVHWWTCVFISLTASKWQLGQDRVWVQDTENSKTSHCGYCPRGHWRPRSRVRRRHRARVLLVKASAGKGSVEENPRTVELTADAISHVVHTSTEDCCGPVARYLLCLSTQFKTAKICFGIYMKNWFRKKKKSESFLCRLVYVWLQALCIFEVQRSYPLISPKNIEALNCYHDCCS